MIPDAPRTDAGAAASWQPFLNRASHAGVSASGSRSPSGDRTRIALTADGPIPRLPLPE
jgi:hypothetical protein